MRISAARNHQSTSRKRLQPPPSTPNLLARARGEVDVSLDKVEKKSEVSRELMSSPPRHGPTPDAATARQCISFARRAEVKKPPPHPATILSFMQKLKLEDMQTQAIRREELQRERVLSLEIPDVVGTFRDGGALNSTVAGAVVDAEFGAGFGWDFIPSDEMSTPTDAPNCRRARASDGPKKRRRCGATPLFSAATPTGPAPPLLDGNKGSLDGPSCPFVFRG